MKKLLKTITAVGTAALAVVGGLYIFRTFFNKDEELDEVFDDEELFDEDTDTEEEVEAFDDESEIFEDETAEEPKAAPTTDSENDSSADPEKDPENGTV
jgi:hypothetical protein